MIIPERIAVESEHDYEDTDCDEDSIDESDSDEFEDEESDDEDDGIGMGVGNDVDPFLEILKIEHKHHTSNGDLCPPRTFCELLKESKGIPNANASGVNTFEFPHKQKIST